MGKRLTLIVLFILLTAITIVTGYIVIEISSYEEVFKFNFIQILFFATLTVPLILIDINNEIEIDEEYIHHATAYLSSRDPKADLKVVQDMAKQMLKTMNEHIKEPCTVMGFKETNLTYEIEFLINEKDFLKSYQEVAIIPFEKVHELTYWQEITRIIIQNSQLRTKPEKATQLKKQQRMQVKPRSTQSKKRSRTKTE